MFLSPVGAMGRYTAETTQTAAGVAALREACKRQLFVYVNSACLAGNVTYNTDWVAIPVVLSIALLAGAVVIFINMVMPAFFPKKDKLEVIKEK